MIEYETPLDELLAPRIARRGDTDERAERLAADDFSNPHDRAHDAPSIRAALPRRLIGRM